MADVRCPVVLGREAELRELGTALRDAVAGRGRVVVVTGEAGIGKSRLARELVSMAEEAGLLVAVGRAAPSGRTTAYRPLTEAMLQALRHHDLPDTPDLAPWLPALGAIVPGLLPGGHGEPTTAVRAEAVLRVLGALGRDRGVALVLEDLHWADPDTLAALDHLVGNLGQEKVVCLATLRVEPGSAAAQHLARWRGWPGVAHLGLGRLDAAQVQAMVQACDPSAGDEVVARVASSAEGVPLVVEELLASPGVPRSLNETVVARLGELGPADRKVLEAAAVLGRTFDWRLLGPATDLGAPAVAAALKRAVDRLLVSPAGDAFRFGHALLRDAVLGVTLPPRRAALAARLLDAMTPRGELGDDQLDLAADLAATAGEPERAASLLVRSGRISLRRGALDTAVETLRRAVEIDPHTALRDEAERVLVEALALAGRLDEAEGVGRALIGRHPDATAEVAEVHLLLAHAAVSATRWPAAAAHLVAARAALGPDGPTALAGRVDVLEGEIALATDDVEQARRLAESVLARPETGPEVRCHALEIVGRVERLVDLEAARRSFEEALALARQHDLAFWRLRALHELGTIELFGSFDTRPLEEARRTAAELGALSTLAVICLQLAAAGDGLFRLDEGMASARTAVELAERLGLDQVRAKGLLFVAENLALRRAADEMEAANARAVAAAPDDPLMAAFTRGGRATLRFLEDDWPGAIAELEAVAATLADLPHVEPAEFFGLWPLLLAASGDLRAPDALAAARAWGLELSSFHRGTFAYTEAILIGPHHPSSATELALAGDAALSMGGPWANVPPMCAAEAAIAKGWGDPERWLRTALACFEEHGLDRLVGRCRRLLGHDGPGAGPAITPREREVLALVAAGMANKQIAATLAVSARTVEKHIESLLRKTGTSSRTQLALAAADGPGGGSVRSAPRPPSGEGRGAP